VSSTLNISELYHSSLYQIVIYNDLICQLKTKPFYRLVSFYGPQFCGY